MATTDREAMPSAAINHYVKCLQACSGRGADVDGMRAVLMAVIQEAAALAAPPVEQLAATPDGEPSNVELRGMWRGAGGSFHGPQVETGTMPEEKLLPFLRSLIAAQAAQPAAQAEFAKGVLTQLLNARGRKDVLHAQHTGKAMSDEVYDVFQRLRDETIPSLTLQLHEMLAATPPAPTEPAPQAGTVEMGKRCQQCIDRQDGFYGSYAPPCPRHDDDGKPRATYATEHQRSQST